MPRPALSSDAIEQQRARTLAAALRLFGEQGVAGVSMRAIASAVQLSPMALYRYFPGGKGEVLATIRGHGFESLALEFGRASAGLQDPIEQILSLTEALLGFALAHSDVYRLMFDLTQPEEHEAYLATRRAAAWKLPAQALHTAIDRGLLQADREIFPHLVFAAVHGVLSFELSGQPSPQRRLERLLGPMLETLFRGAGAGPLVLRKIRKTFRREPHKPTQE